MEELLKYILQNLVSKPEKISISKKEEGADITFIIQVDDEDKGKIIGKGGRNIKAIRDILVVLAKRSQQKVFLKIE